MHENVNIKIGGYVWKSRKTSQIPSSRGAEIRFSQIILFPDSRNYSGKPRSIQVEFPSLRYVSLYSSVVWASNFIVVITYNWCKIVFVECSDWHFSVHAWEKIMYATREEHDDSHPCFCALASLGRNFTLVRIILSLPCSINIYFIL